jgi:hypothetical protein
MRGNIWFEMINNEVFDDQTESYLNDVGVSCIKVN